MMSIMSTRSALCVYLYIHKRFVAKFCSLNPKCLQLETCSVIFQLAIQNILLCCCLHHAEFQILCLPPKEKTSLKEVFNLKCFYIIRDTQTLDI